MDKDYIIRLIRTFNPQWEAKKIDVPEFKREIYADIKKYMGKKQIIALTGLRRIGKTTLMKQLITELPARSCMYFSFDEKDLQKKDVLNFVINYFLNNFNGKYMFLDEIHYIDDWQGVLKRYYDTTGLKFIISGSASLQIRKGRESLAGRIIALKLSPLTFGEFLALSGEKVVLKKNLKKTYECLLPKKEFFESMFNEYIYKGGFPEIVKETDEEFIRSYIKEMIIRKIIFEDIPEIFDIKRKDVLYDMFKFACKESSNLFEIKNLSSMTKLNVETISNYLLYLRLSFLIKISETYSKSMATRIRKNKKIYVSHPSIAFAVLNYPKNILGVEKLMGQYVETLFAEKFFWRSKEKHEVDAVAEIKDKPVPIEIKYRDQIMRKDLKGVLKFCDKFGCEKGIIITKDMFKEETIDNKKIQFIPAWLFSLWANAFSLD
ncbi:MAG: ATP-binding protein [Candidatus Aenigmarchaeota archaeon]|nr:ATP-binding protein [Candidatus Aenigmarchaeota archaeon]